MGERTLEEVLRVEARVVVGVAGRIAVDRGSGWRDNWSVRRGDLRRLDGLELLNLATEFESGHFVEGGRR